MIYLLTQSLLLASIGALWLLGWYLTPAGAAPLMGEDEWKITGTAVASAVALLATVWIVSTVGMSTGGQRE